MADDEETRAAPAAEERLAALLRDLGELGDYLTQRGRHAYELAQRFLESAHRSGTASSTRAYDERQATMLDYWHSILSDMNAALWWLFAKASPAKAVPNAITPIAQSSSPA